MHCSLCMRQAALMYSITVACCSCKSLSGECMLAASPRIESSGIVDCDLRRSKTILRGKKHVQMLAIA